MSTTGSLNKAPIRRTNTPETRTSESSTSSSNREPLSIPIAPPIVSIGSADHDADRGQMDTFEWDLDTELVFYKLLIGIRPVGVNRHFNMMVIYDKFIKELNRDPNTIHVDDLWRKLETLYDLEGLEGNPESINPGERRFNEEKEFALPKEFSGLLRERQRQLSPSPTQIGTIALSSAKK
jgi:hypothetical protein